jgi:hypothetical protein
MKHRAWYGRPERRWSVVQPLSDVRAKFIDVKRLGAYIIVGVLIAVAGAGWGWFHVRARDTVYERLRSTQHAVRSAVKTVSDAVARLGDHGHDGTIATVRSPTLSLGTTPNINTPYSSLAGNTLPGGHYPYYPHSPYHRQIPHTPEQSPANFLPTSSSDCNTPSNICWDEWENGDANQGINFNGNFSDFVISEDGSGNSGDDPTYYTRDGDGSQSTSLACALKTSGSSGKYFCDNTLPYQSKGIVEFWSNSQICATTIGATARNFGCPIPIAFPIPPGVLAASDTDHHINFIQPSSTYNGIKGYEISGWGAGAGGVGDTAPVFTRPVSGVWTFGALGACSLHGDGTACGAAYATRLAGSLGLIRAEDILYCLDNLTPATDAYNTCTLPTALSVAPKCNNSRAPQYPATASDMSCVKSTSSGNINISTSDTGPTEGSRGCLDMSDSTINAMSMPDYAKVVWRTIDCSHYGMFVRDTNWQGGPGIVWQYQGGEAYYSMNQVDPWKTLAKRIGTAYSSSSMSFAFSQIPIFANPTTPNIVWCVNARNDGLCD